MKKIFILYIISMSCINLIAQQLPVSESYFVDKYSFSPAYAGMNENKVLFAGYRHDWSGLSEGPQTFRLSYQDRFFNNSGLGGKILLDKFGIFQQFIGVGSYSYGLKISEEQDLRLALSAGVFQNSINFTKYYADPVYSQDPSISTSDLKSKMKYISDFAVIYGYRKFQAGLMFTSVGFGNAKYENSEVKYKPMSNYQFHIDYTVLYDDLWTIEPMVIYRGGKNISGFLEVACLAKYKNWIWMNLGHRGTSTWSFGVGVNASRKIILNYNFNSSSSITTSVYQNHEITMGFLLGDLFMTKGN